MFIMGIGFYKPNQAYSNIPKSGTKDNHWSTMVRRNETLHSDLDLAKIETVIHSSYTRLFATLSTHSNNLINQIPRNLPPARPDRRLKRKRHTDLLML
ncbi:hypothetical protein ANN_09848 [Periplaneta americana]|uniref:Uncharacterized protein n=1 Tax=Periplaneta americana TaxID=6978 RepID=A0ABQ8TR26_PERAM|nr:hypothetical protein ANN_09848 [Periplaneta americana]